MKCSAALIKVTKNNQLTPAFIRNDKILLKSVNFKIILKRDKKMNKNNSNNNNEESNICFDTNRWHPLQQA